MADKILRDSQLYEASPEGGFEALCTSTADALDLEPSLVQHVSLALASCGELPAEAAHHVRWPNAYSVFSDGPQGKWHPSLDDLLDFGETQFTNRL
jgi:hypothetical protein